MDSIHCSKSYSLALDVIEADDIVVLVGSEKNFNQLFAELAE
jgi:trk system potassium uptake protein TrkA